MSHMQPEITDKGYHWEIDTQAGIWYVPGDVAPVPDWVRFGPLIQDDWVAMFEDHLSQFIEPNWDHVNSIRVVQGYCGRMQAPGYLDSTDWSFDRTLKGIRDQLAELYGG